MSRKQLQAEVRKLLEATDRTSDNVEVKKGSTQIVLPESMSYDEAIEWLHRKREEDESEVGIRHTINCHPLDGAFALLRAIKDTYGWSQMVPTPGFFGSTPPAMVTMQTSPKESMQVPWGRMKIPGIAGFIDLNYQASDSIPGFVIGGKTLNKDKHKVHDLAKKAQAIVEQDSIYHGKALSVNLEWLREGRDFDPDVHGFKFMDLSGVDGLVFDEDTEGILDTTLFALIEDADKMRANNVPLKRGILLEGPFGVGKTLTAKVTAAKAVANGWTFMLCEDARDLEQVIHLARRYEPVVIFCEDIDRVVLQKRTIGVDKILNIMDGIGSKDSEMIAVLTTNHVEKIQKGLIRPGRLDAVIPLRAPDADAAIRLVRQYGGELMSTDEDLSDIGDMLAGKIPAVIREVVERSKIARIRHGHDDIRSEDLRIAAKGMERHLALLEEKEEIVPMAIQMADTIGDRIGNAFIDSIDDLANRVREKMPCN
jgi:transitional endoplasmic reticulum ATPase